MPELPRGEVTFLFTDVVGSTGLWETQGHLMPAAYARHDELLRGAVEAHGGVVYKTIGDAFQAAFPDAPSAVAATLAAQRVLAAEAWGLPSPLRVRTVLHVGEVEPLPDGDYRSPILNRLGRLLGVGNGGQILLSSAVAEAARGALPAGAGLRDLGERRLKDLAQADRLFQVLHPELPDDFPPLRTLDYRPHNLPVQLTPFVGREGDIAAVRERLERPGLRLLTLTGPGGIGKTRLSLQAAAELLERFADGVFFVPLEAVTDPTLVPSAVAEALGVREFGDQPLAEAVREHLRERELLLVLDNFEQVLDAAPPLGELLAACRGVTLLVSSRQVLRIHGEHEYAVPPLGLPPAGRGGQRAAEEIGTFEAVRLFVERAAAARADFRLTPGNAADVSAICAELDGLPLAIELAAARVKLLPPAALLARLEKRLALLTGGGRDRPSRQQTLRGAIAWSHDLLPAAERALFRRLAVFAGGATLEAVEAVAASRGVEGSRGREVEEGVADGRSEPWRRAIEEGRASPAPTGVATPRPLDLDVFDGVASLVDKSLVRQEEGAEGEPRFALLATIREFGLERLEEAGEAATVRDAHAAFFLALAEAAEPGLKGSEQERWLGRLEAEHDNLRAALGWFQGSGASESQARLAGALSRFWWVRGHLSEGRAWLGRALDGAVDVSPTVRAKALKGAGALALFQRDAARARDLTEQAVAEYRAAGDRAGVAQALCNLGSVAAEQGDLGRADALYEEGVSMSRELGDRLTTSVGLNGRGAVAFLQGDYERAVTLYGEGLAVARAAGDRQETAIALANLGEARQHQGNLDAAGALYGQALPLFRALGDLQRTAFALDVLGRLAVAQGDVARAVGLFEESLALSDRVGDKVAVVGCVEGIAGAAVLGGEAARAARLFGAAAALRDAMGAPRPAVYAAAYERQVGAARAALGAGFAAAWDAGWGWSLEAAVDEAVRGSETEWEEGRPVPAHGGLSAEG